MRELPMSLTHVKDLNAQIEPNRLEFLEDVLVLMSADYVQEES